MLTPDDVLDFWFGELEPKQWYEVDPALDARIRDRFEAGWRDALAGRYDDWLNGPRSALALIVLLDQFPRNMFRGSAESFASDRKALGLAKRAIDRGWDRREPEPDRQFFYLPLMHSECLCDQDRSVRLILTRMPESGSDNLLHARAHREVIRRFGRFPYRNDALARETTRPEADYIAAGGYGATVREIQQDCGTRNAVPA